MSKKKSKECQYCKQKKKLSEFPKHNLYKDRLDTRCRQCIKEHRKVRDGLHKVAPPKPKRCECCNQESKKLCLDHDHQNDSFRGFICERCNTGIGKLGDNLEGVIKAVNYLILVRNRNQQNESQKSMENTSN